MLHGRTAIKESCGMKDYEINVYGVIFPACICLKNLNRIAVSTHPLHSFTTSQTLQADTSRIKPLFIGMHDSSLHVMNEHVVQLENLKIFAAMLFKVLGSFASYVGSHRAVTMDMS